MLGSPIVYDSLNPHAWYCYMRQSSPVLYEQQRQAWYVFRYTDVQYVLHDTATFSSCVWAGPGIGSSMVSSDPPRHQQLRSLVALRFTPRRIARMEERITAIVHELLDAVIGTGCMDVIDDLASPFPVTVIAEMLGIPLKDRVAFRRWSTALMQLSAGGNAVFSEIGPYFAQVIEQRRHEPGDDLISALLTAEIEGERLSEQDLLGFCILLLVAGNETTTNLIGNAMQCFDEQPGLFETLRAEPALLPNAIEEVLRYRSPIKMVARIAKMDTELGGQKIRAGQNVILWIGAANNDEAVFPGADRFDIRRTPNRHIGFGHGIHFCMGAPLARLEAKVALTAMLERLGAIKRVEGVPLEPVAVVPSQGIKHFPITFAAR